ncbi:cupin domain-containing protein [Streptomyces acidiscabies]|uniref:Cupin domain-containing protein n=1 Tax=Streptomyces acidiscabies TaxID=42234 RepID=A0AAP6BAN1_9ACTN|nr:cupin domain-containing protein [Streptomyces acidiscabies]MBP5935164.1 cupin domain-containing protein [Streptomyces sp. LBUM 1476]MBZ3917022.1 cupin domain-containing protein [Streptomyces acidiscabies]MDX2961261.1 cupin domain-containing protein [Streptomyces acidiscabies]MDX3022619.1 cupin domain-containing protein [Streptomyces acidiscabies]MDX3791983.1 cupin domain-containing protein [Streptomyces acidiscabies]
MQITRVRPDSVQGPAENFTGAVRLDEIAVPPAPSRLRIYHVHFSPGAHTAWHRHPHGQVLHVTDGEGLVQREGGAVEAIRAGDTVWIEPGELHWHGAGPRTGMSHIATVEAAADGTTVDWADHVDPHDYARAHSA